MSALFRNEFNFKTRDRTPCRDPRASDKKRGFCPKLATFGGGAHPCARLALDRRFHLFRVVRSRWTAGHLVALLLFMWVHPSRANDAAELDDAAAQMQYAYYTRDERALRAGLNDVERMSVPEAAQVWREYELGIGYWRLAEVSQTSSNSVVVQTLSRCEEHLDAALRLQPALVEAKAVRGLCAVRRGATRASNAHPPKRECLQQADVTKAFELAPRNPHVLYVHALCALQDGDLATALDHAQRAWSAFEQAPLGAAEHSSWGQAETCLLLAQLQLRQGNRAAARDHVEQALVLAPDYVAARELLKQIAAVK